mmetsp:Transcript_39434/g.92111  ORF Transcript_39434/g.92111 Transcript_39434/m.92111 type:complete len:86 (-) Transcript_39434:688-945(-)
MVVGMVVDVAVVGIVGFVVVVCGVDWHIDDGRCGCVLVRDLSRGLSPVEDIHNFQDMHVEKGLRGKNSWTLRRMGKMSWMRERAG